MIKQADKISEREIEIVLINEPEGIIRMEIDPDKIIELSESIRTMGLLQAILVRPVGKRFEIVYGHRRLLAHKALGLTKIRATVKKLDDIQCALMRATENIEREEISAIEEAAVYENLFKNHELNIDQISKRMGKSAGIIRRRMDLLRMPPCLQQAIHEKKIGYSVAEELWRLPELSDIEYYLGFAVDHGATQGVVRQWVKERLDEKRRAGSGTDRGMEETSPMEARKYYVSCDTCQEALEIGSETVLRICPSCAKAIARAMEEA